MFLVKKQISPADETATGSGSSSSMSTPSTRQSDVLIEAEKLRHIGHAVSR